MDFQQGLLDLRVQARKCDVVSLFRCHDTQFSLSIDKYIHRVFERQYEGERVDVPVGIAIRLRPEIVQKLCDEGLVEQEIQSYLDRFDEFAEWTVLSVLALVFELDIGFKWSPGLVCSECRGLEYDRDKLLAGPDELVDFVGPRTLLPADGGQPMNFSRGSTKEGVVFKDSYIIPFHQRLARYNLGLSGGFLRTLSNFVELDSSLRVRFRVSEDTLLDLSRHKESFTAAYIRGPKGVSESKLQSESFPQDPRGDVTEHLWVDDGSSESSISKWMFPLEKFQVMWSSRGSLKTCQAEEIVRLDNRTSHVESRIYNRYSHAIWDTAKGCFTHFDGAIRGYPEGKYPSRVAANDIRHADEWSEDYIKLWRLDGEIPFGVWSELFVKFFDQNHLAREYIEDGF